MRNKPLTQFSSAKAEENLASPSRGEGAKLFFAKRLRKEMTEAEKKLWSKLRARRLDDRKFRRQVPLGPYILDFVCLKKKLIIEIDGGQHAEEKNKKYDQVRDAYFVKRGYRILRFWNNEVLSNIDGILSEIDGTLANLSPLPLRERVRVRGQR